MRNLSSIIGLPLAVLASAASAQANIDPPADATRAVEGSVTLRAGSHAATMQTLRVLRQIPLDTIRANPSIALGRTQVNFAPVLNNPGGLINLGARLSTMPQQVELISDHSELVEVEQGLLLHNFVSYRIKPGVCSDGARRRQIGNSGIDCFKMVTEAERTARFATPGDAHYVSDPRRRAGAVAMAQKAAERAHQAVAKHLATFREMLADPVKRQPIVANLGAAEVERLAGLNDESLQAELINTSKHSAEDVLFVPNVDAPASGLVARLQTTPSREAALRQRETMFSDLASRASIAQRSKIKVPAGAGDHFDEFTLLDQDTGEEGVLLTGFTLAKQYEWKARAEVTIDWCVIDCSDTYYVEASAGFHFAVGLRFPIKIGGKTHFNHVNGQDSADVTPTFELINGSSSQFAATGLPADLLFDGKELVAQFGAHGGFGYSLPSLLGAALGIPGSGGASTSVEIDATDYLPAPFTGGQFRPPAPHDSNPPRFMKVFDQIDLLGGIANFGVAGAVVNPAVGFELRSNDLHLTLHDLVNGTERKLTQSGQSIPLGVDAVDHSAHFAIGDPVYNLALEVTPGIDPKLFIDIDVWSDSWSWPIWFPQASVELPPGGADFSCHYGTQCARLYKVSSRGIEAKQEDNLAAARDSGQNDIQFASGLNQWKNDFSSNYMSSCTDSACKVGVSFIRTGYALGAQQRHAQNPSLTFQAIKSSYLVGADADAKVLVDESQARQTKVASNSFAALQFAIWSNRCSDSLCIHNLHGILFFEVWEMNAEQQQHPDESTQQIIAKVGQQYAVAAEQEIAASKGRSKKFVFQPMGEAITVPAPHRIRIITPTVRQPQ